jgi:signal transduction histidine kinase
MTSPEPRKGLGPMNRPGPELVSGPGRETSPEPPSRLERWERREQPVLAALPYVMLAFATLATVVIKFSGGLAAMLPDLGLSAFTAVWMAWFFPLHPGWRERPRVMGVFFVGLLVLMATLVIRDPWFGFFTFTGYFFVFWLATGRVRLLGVLAVATITGTSQNGGLPKHAGMPVVFWIAIVLINMTIAGTLTWFGWVSSEQNDRRKQALTDLSEANRKLEATLAENVGLHEQLLTQAREAGVLDERQRMAREIHDTLAQGLTGIITQLQAAEQSGQSAEGRRRHIDLATQLARGSLSEARRSVQAMAPEPLVAARLPEALAGVAEKWSAQHGVPAAVTVTGEPARMRPEVEVTLLRAAQEALANVARHASAAKVGLTLSYMEDQVTLDIRDDGVGFDPDRAGAALRAATRAGAAGGEPGTAGGDPAGGGAAGSGAAGAGDTVAAGNGFGLMAMRQRIEGVAGTLEIESGPGTGTAISASVPVTAAGSAA